MTRVETERYDTYGPILTRLGTFVAAFVDQGVFEKPDVEPMPWKERIRKVDLSPNVNGAQRASGREARRTLKFKSTWIYKISVIPLMSRAITEKG